MYVLNCCESGKENPINKSDYLYIGVDVHKETHTAVLMTFLEEKLGDVKITNNLKGFQKLNAFVEKAKEKYKEKNQGKELRPLYGLEDVSRFGRNLAIHLLGKEQIVKEVNSALSYMERKSYPTMKKSDSWDAQCVCAVLIRRHENLPDADPKDYYWVMRQLFHRRNALVRTRTKLLQQFHDQIQYDYPSYKKFFHEVECKTSIAFFEKYPSSYALMNVSVEELGEFLKEVSRSAVSTKKAEEILELVEEDAIKPYGYQFCRDFIIQSMMRNICFVRDELDKIDVLQKQLLKERNYHLETVPGINTVTASALVALIGDINRFENNRKLANYAGIAPLCFGSGSKEHVVQNKEQGNRELYAVFYLLAIQQICMSTKGDPRNPVFRAYYERKIAEGKTKIQSLLCIMRRLVNIIYSMMKNQTEYRIPMDSKVEVLEEKQELKAS